MTATKPPVDIATVGNVVNQVDVTIGPKFLNLFSEHLYSSPNKAFEELVSNSWDAGASNVYIRVPEILDAEKSAVWVLDNGASMDVEGLKQLWAVAESTKRTRPPANGRPPIGKFGIGKLATYLLANQVTYVCRAGDGIVRAVTMDYRTIEGTDGNKLHIDVIKLDVRELSPQELEALLADYDDGDKIFSLLQANVPRPADIPDWNDEYGGVVVPAQSPTGAWTLVSR